MPGWQPGPMSARSWSGCAVTSVAQRSRKIETCSECGGTVKVIASIEDPVVIKQILNHLKHKAETNEPRALPENRAPPAELPQGLFD